MPVCATVYEAFKKEKRRFQKNWSQSVKSKDAFWEENCENQHLPQNF